MKESVFRSYLPACLAYKEHTEHTIIAFDSAGKEGWRELNVCHMPTHLLS
jgi:hypothetical protein